MWFNEFKKLLAESVSECWAAAGFSPFYYYLK